MKNDKSKQLRVKFLFLLFLASTVILWLPVSKTFAAEELCQSCRRRVSVEGDLTHRKDDASRPIQGAGGNEAAYREEINGTNFTVSIPNLPESTYNIIIGFVESTYGQPGERLFNVTSGDVTLAENFDIFATAGGTGKVCELRGVVEHLDDSLRGPLQLTFTAVNGSAKFNTIEITDISGTPMVEVSAFELANPFAEEAARIPEISDPPIWRDPTKPMRDRIDDLIRRMSLEEKVAQVRNDAPAIPRLGLPAYNYWNEALHGVANNGDATVFPEPVGMASTWNPELMRREGTVVGIEGRAKHNDYANQNNGDSKWWTGLTFWTPNINIFRDPRWGRGQETYGEDPYFTGVMSSEFVKGMQGDDPNYLLSMACAKHYAVHSGPEPDRHSFNAEPSERDLYEMYLPQFETVVKEGKVAGVMSAYNAINGVPVSADSFFLEKLLREDWGFEGYIVSDCDAIRDIYNARAHNYVETPEEAAALAVKAGTNLCCGGDYNSLVLSVQKGLISEEEVDEALYYTLWTRFRLGMFDPPEMVPYAKYTLRDSDTPEHGQVALEVARQSLVLLKNDGILPIDRSKYKRIAVIGPNGKSTSMLEGNYHGSASHPVSIFDGITQLAGPNIEITSAQGSPITTDSRRAPWSGQDNETDRPLDELRAEAVALAENADLVIYAGGLTAGQEGESFDRSSIELPPVQTELIRALHATGKPMVMVNCSGSAMALLWESENLPALLQAWYPGQNGGQAVAEVLFGAVNPSGHLPLTFYRATTDLPDFSDYSFSNRTYRYFSGTPLYAFGHGLSYTDFEYSNGRLASNRIPADGTAQVTFTVKNGGNLDGDDVVQVYYRHVDSDVPQPKLALCGFTRLNVKQGESETVTIDVPTDRLRYWDTETKQYIVEPGKYEILIAAASDDIRLTLPMTITTR
ncbi:glycoside hydrolase family 3 C-terminal domain-containing protein [Candidatus Latescibacterota bacterium]